MANVTKKNGVGLVAGAVLVLLLAGGVFGQVQTNTISIPTGVASVVFRMSSLQPGVAGAPYSAQQVREHTETLADGTHIVNPVVSTLVFRDSQGRLRTERPWMIGPKAPPNPPMLIQIRDTVAGVVYVLDTQHRIAYRATITPPPAPPPSPPSPAPAPFGTMPATNIPLANGVQLFSEPLGTQMMEGVKVEGRRYTRTYPVGTQGNDKPIVSLGETWFSPELQVVVLERQSDPRSGETIIRLTNIIRGEPQPELFQPPADYKIVDDTGSSTIQFTIPR